MNGQTPYSDEKKQVPISNSELQHELPSEEYRRFAELPSQSSATGVVEAPGDYQWNEPQELPNSNVDSQIKSTLISKVS